MKTTIIIISIGIILSLVIACSTPKVQTTEVVVLLDKTDSLIAKPKVDDIMNLLDLQGASKGAIFKLSEITDVSFNPITEIDLPGSNPWFSNEFDREKEVSAFKTKVGSIIQTANQDKIGKSNSSIYLPIAQTLKELSSSKPSNKILIIYSDLMENTPELSFYNENDFAKCKENPEKVVEYFNGLEKLPSLTGIEIWLIYQPVNNSDDIKFRAVSNVYKQLLESKGAIVSVSASITQKR